MTIALDTSTADGKSIVSFLNPIKGLLASNAVIKVTVPKNEVSQFTFAIWDNSSRTGTLEKYGEGELFLASRLKLSSSSTTVADYETHHHVFAGTVRWTEAAETGHKYHATHSVIIERPAKVVTLFNECIWQMRGLYGEGMITNEAASLCTLYVCETTSKGYDGGEFKGAIGGKIAVQARSCDLTLSGTSSTYTDGVSGATIADNRASTIYLADFGEKSRTGSSAGLGTAVLTLSDHTLVYTGLGQTTDRDFQFNYRNSILNAGTNGNLVYRGTLRRWDTTKRNPSLFLSGDNKYRSVFAPYGIDCNANALGEFTRVVNSQTVTYNQYFGKRGTGEWHFPLTGRFRNTGVFAVENGTLSYPSIDRTGELTPLGLSTRLYDNVDQPTDAAKVSYAFLLGSDKAGETGLMSCTTNLARQCTDRPFGLKGRGGFLADAGLVKYANVFGVGTGDRTLVLAGTNAWENEVHDVRDGDVGCVVSVEKNGTGTWVLGGDQTFTGSLTVNGGKLVVRRPAQKYQRYRLLVLEMVNKCEEFGGSPTSTGTEFHIAEIGLYAADNSRQNLNLVYNPAYAALQPGQCALGLNRVWGGSLTSGPYNVFELLYDGYRKRFKDEEETSASWHAITGNSFKSEGGFTTPSTPTLGQPLTYVPFDMYLTADAQPIHHFDVMCSSSGNIYSPSRMQLLGSVDGIHWDELSDVAKIAAIAPNNNYWLSGLGGGGYTDGGSPSAVITSQTKSTGWLTTNSAPTKVFSLLEHVGPVTVANGATLKYEGAADGAPALSWVKLAAGATGSIDGFAFAESGTFEIDAMPQQSVDVAVALPNAKGLANVSGWQVKVGDTLKPNYRVKATADGFTVTKSGLTVIFR